MNSTKALFLNILLVLTLPLYALDINNTFYGSVTDYLLSINGIDDNQGLTSLPVLSIPMGGRSEGLATAFAAVADDASYIEWNPAGSSMLSNTELSFYHNNWIADTKIEGLVYTQRLGNLGIGAGGKWLYLPFTEYNEFGDRASKGFYSETVAILNASYNFFSGYYFSGVSLGTNIKTAIRLVPDYSNDKGSIISGSGASQSTMAPMLDIGALSRFNFMKFYYSRERNSAVALVVKNLGFPAQGDPLPTEAVFGIAYKPIRPIQWSFDTTIPINLVNPELSEKPYWATGLSAQITDFLGMRTGLLFKSGNIRITIGSAILVDTILVDVNYTLDLLTQLQPLNRVSVGAKFNFGDQGRGERAKQVEALYLAGLEAYARGETDTAIQNWEAALKLDPHYDPAKEGLKALIGAEALSKRILEIQKIE
jgi:hypothetical protein